MEDRAPLIIAIDGPAGSGKSTVAKTVAEWMKLPYIDTGAMYRAVAYLALQNGVDFEDEAAVTQIAQDARIDFACRTDRNRLCLNDEPLGPEIRTPEVSQGASKVSTIPEVRTALTERQRELGHEYGCVMEGRDIGTVVFPDAQVKVFLTASPDERIRRRTEELGAKGEDVDRDEVRAQIEERDKRDSERDHAPLKPAPDAHHLSTDGLTIDEVVERIVALCPPETVH